MRIDLNAQDKAYCEVVGVVKPPDFIITTREEYDRNFAAWRNSLPDADEKTLHRKVIGRIVHKQSGPIPTVRSGDPAAVQDAVNATHVETQRHIRDLTEKHLPEIAEIHRDGNKEVAKAINRLASEMDDKERLFRELHETAAKGASEERNTLALVAHRDSVRSEKWLRAIAILIFLLIAATLFAPKAHAQFSKINYMKWQQGGSDIPGGFFSYPYNVNCSTNITCTVSGSTLTITATGGAGSGTVTNTGTLTSGRFAIANGGVDITASGSDLTYSAGVVKITKLQIGDGIVTLPTDPPTLAWFGPNIVSTDFAIAKNVAPGADAGLLYTGQNIGFNCAPSVNVPTSACMSFLATTYVDAAITANMAGTEAMEVNLQDDGAGTRTAIYGQDVEVTRSGGSTVAGYGGYFNISSTSNFTSEQTAVYGLSQQAGAGVVNHLAGVYGATLATAAAQSGWAYGVYGLATSSTTSGTNPLNVGGFFETAVTTGTVTQDDGVYAKGVVSGGTVTSNHGGYFSGNVSGGTVTSNYGLRVANSLTGGTVTNNYGLNIGAITGGGAINRAIKTSTGFVELGDDLIFTNDNTDDVGAVAANRPRTIYAGTSMVAPNFTGTASVAATGDSATAFFSAGTIEVARGGTGAAPGADDQLLVSDSTSGATWRTLTTCTGAGKAITYDVTTNTFGCNTIAGTVSSVAQSFTGGLISVGGSPVTTTGTLALTVAGTSGGIPYFSSGSTWATTAALGANLPVIGGGAGVAPSTGTRSGNTTAFVTTTGTQTSGDCVKIDANGNHVANGSACGGGSATTYEMYPDAASTTGTAADQVVMSASVTNPGAGKCVTFTWGYIDFSGSGTFNLKVKLGTTTSSSFLTASVGVNTNWNGQILLCNKSAVSNAQFYQLSGTNFGSTGLSNSATTNVSFSTEDWTTAKTVALVVNASNTANWRSAGGKIY